jgi:isocitrate dehydrogenase
MTTPQPEFKDLLHPSEGERIALRGGRLVVPERPIIPFIEGDGAGPDLWRAAQAVFDAAVKKAYGGSRRIVWFEVLAGEKAFSRFRDWLPQDTLSAMRHYLVSIKGPLTMPAGGGIRALNVALCQMLDLYVCLRPVRWLEGVPSPVKHPERVNAVIFRENTEDHYAGIEWEAGSEGARRMVSFIAETFPREYARIRFPEGAGIGVKSVSVEGTERLIRAALRYALAEKRRSVTVVHKGNTLKFTEGAFRTWAHGLATREFGERIYGWEQWERTRKARGEAAANAEQKAAAEQGKLLLREAEADIALQRILACPGEFDVIATTNLNGDYLSDAVAAQVGGIGIAPGGNINYETGHAVFEATHGTAPEHAGLDRVNPASVILSGEMMFRYLGWTEAADLILRAMGRAIASRRVTQDLARLMRLDGLESVVETKCSEFGRVVIDLL